MSARIDTAKRVAPLGGRAGTTTGVDESDVKDASLLVRILTAILEDVADLKRRFVPRRTTFPPTALVGDGTTKYRFPHNFGTAPDILIVGWDGAAAPNVKVHQDSNGATLVLVSLSAGTATIRLEKPE